MSLLADIALAVGLVVGLAVAILALVFSGGLGAYKVLTVVVEGGFYLGARHRLAAGHGSWSDLDDYLHVAWRDGTYTEHQPRLHHLYDIVDDTARNPADSVNGKPGIWRPDLPPAVYRWVRDGHPAGLLFDAIAAGYSAAALDAHRVGDIALDDTTVQTMRALRD